MFCFADYTLFFCKTLQSLACQMQDYSGCDCTGQYISFYNVIEVRTVHSLL